MKTVVLLKGQYNKDAFKQFPKKHWVNTLIKPIHHLHKKDQRESFLSSYPKSPITLLHNSMQKELIDSKDIITEQNRIKEQEATELRILEEIGELVRKDQTRFTQVSAKIFSEICKKLKIHYGILYYYNPENELIESVATYAIDRNKYENITIMKGEGFIGQTVLELKPTHLNNVPQDYVKISSGLGAISPREMYFSPIIYNNEVVGVIELASIKAFTPESISLIEQICDILAAAIRDTTTTEKTTRLLQTAQEATQQLREQEEELKQNAEELQANQEELERKVKMQMQCIQQLQREEDNIIINIAGRNRMLSQQIAFYAELVHQGKSDKVILLNNAIELHDHTINTLKNGGVPRNIDYSEPLPPSNTTIQPLIKSVEKLWEPYKEAAENIVQQNEDSTEAMHFIEDNTQELLKLNNELVSAYMKESDAWRKNVFTELSDLFRESA